MSAQLLPLLYGAAAGALMAVQGTLNSVLGKTIGLPRTNLFVQVFGAATAALLLFAPWRNGGTFARLGQAPWYALLGGPIGAAIIFAVATSIGRLGAGTATTAIIIAQLLAAYLIDHFGLFGLQRLPFDILKAIGIALVAGGGWLLLR